MGRFSVLLLHPALRKANSDLHSNSEIIAGGWPDTAWLGLVGCELSADRSIDFGGSPRLELFL